MPSSFLDNSAHVKRSSLVLMSTYSPPTIALVRGEGCWVWDAQENAYLDFFAGFAVNVLGHAHPAVVEAVTLQVSRLGHISNTYVSPVAVELAERLIGHLEDGPGGGSERGTGRVFFCNSGTEANEAAFKLARRTGRPDVVAMEGGFHGRTMGSLALTGQVAKRDPFLPLPGPVRYVPYGDAGALDDAVDGATSAVFVEPIQGENGVLVPPAGFLRGARSRTSETGSLLVVDEVQTGIGRTGDWFAYQRAEIRPDVVTLAKGLGGGLPLGACVAFGEAASLFTRGQHGSTFGGNPIACAAGLAVLDTIEREGLVPRARYLGDHIMGAISALKHPLIDRVRGRGLLIGVVLRRPVAKDLARAAQAAGLLINAPSAEVIRLAPPLVISDEQVDGFLTIFAEVLDIVYACEVPLT